MQVQLLKSTTLGHLLLIIILQIYCVATGDYNTYWAVISFLILLLSLIGQVILKLTRPSQQYKQVINFVIRFYLIIDVFSLRYLSVEQIDLLRYFIAGSLVQKSLKLQFNEQSRNIRLAEKMIIILTTLLFMVPWQQKSQGSIYDLIVGFLLCFIFIINQIFRFKYSFQPGSHQKNHVMRSSLSLSLPQPKDLEKQIQEPPSQRLAEQEFPQGEDNIKGSQKLLQGILPVQESNQYDKLNPIYVQMLGPQIQNWQHQLKQEQPNSWKQDMFKQIFNSMSDGITVVNKQKKILFVNNKMKKMLFSSSKREAFNRLMSLQNCKGNLKEQQDFTDLFNYLDKKFDSKKDMVSLQFSQHSKELANANEQYKSFDSNDNLEKDQNEDELSEVLNMQAMMKSQFSELPTVKVQVEEAISQLVNNYNMFADQYSHDLPQQEYWMICQFQMNENTSQHKNYASSDNATFNTSHMRKKPLYQIDIRIIDQQYILIMSRDVTQINHIQMLKTINQNKSKMLSQVSHEFRTPLHCIILFMKALSTYLDENLIKQYLDPTISSAQQLMSLVNDLLDVSQLKAGKFKLNMLEFDLDKLLKDIIDIMAIQANTKQITLDLQFLLAASKYITSDPNRIRQVVINLIGNAIKFTKEKGAIIVSVKAQANDLVEISVIDNGYGISKDNQSKLFSQFGKLADPTQVNTQGVGLGLMISNILAKRLAFGSGADENTLGGLIVNSEGEGKGAKFTFWVFNSGVDQIDEEVEEQQSEVNSLDNESIVFEKQKQKGDQNHGNLFQFKKLNYQYPIARQNSGSALDIDDHSSPIIIQQKQRKSIVPQKCKCPQILIVDDNGFNIMALQSLLEKKKFKIDSVILIKYNIKAQSGYQAIKKVDNFEYCVQGCKNYKIIMMDIDMPQLNGIQTTRHLVEIFKVKKISCVIWGVSGYDDEAEKQQCLKAGMNNYFVKPPNLNQLLIQIHKELQQDVEFPLQ